MKSYTLSPRTLSLDDSWDVIVAGGGPAGCAAAAAAAREGARTLLIESTGALGGAGTNALVPAWCPFSDKEKIIYRGLAEKVFNASKSGVAHLGAAGLDWVPIDAEHLKGVYDDLVTDAGATTAFHTFLTSVEKEGDSLSALLVADKSGLRALRAKVYVDCTGDADLCGWAGAEVHMGDATGDLMPATHCFVLTNVDEYAFRYLYANGSVLHGSDPTSPLYDILASGRYPLIPDAHCCASLIGPRTVGFNAGHLWGVDNTDPATVSPALRNGRKLARQYRDALAEFCPEAFGNALLMMTGSVMGIRETRRIVGDYVLTLEDYLARRTFPDDICRNSYFIDIHHAFEDAKNDVEERTEGLKGKVQYDPGESHGIPYRCLTPKGLPNVLVAGRSVSCDRYVQGSVRVMPVCLAMGEAAGLAAALAAEADSNTHHVDTQILRSKLIAHGAYLPPEK